MNSAAGGAHYCSKMCLHFEFACGIHMYVVAEKQADQ